MNASSPSFRLIELTTALPCTHFRPASITDHFDESIMIGTRATSGSEAIRFRKRHHGLLGIEHALVHVDVDDLRAVVDLLARHGNGRRVVVRFDQAAKNRRPGDVAALTDVDEQVVRTDVEWLEPGETALDRQCPARCAAPRHARPRRGLECVRAACHSSRRPG